MQLPLHSVKPLVASHSGTQAPAAHAAAPFSTGSQALPQSPQCSGSIVTSRHAPPQALAGGGHSPPHTPCSHVGVPPTGGVHFPPHAPQFSGSLAASVS